MRITMGEQYMVEHFPVDVESLGILIKCRSRFSGAAVGPERGA